MNLPGCILPFDIEWGEECAKCGKKAAISIQGETDSFGCEKVNYCSLKCYQEEQKDQGTNSNGDPHYEVCPCCKTCVPKLVPYRDYDEGLNGPVYYACSECHKGIIQRQKEEAAEELAAYDDYGDNDFEDDSDRYVDLPPNHVDLDPRDVFDLT